MNSILRVWHIPQIPMNNPFYVEVENPKEAARILRILWNYDDYQYRNLIKPDYSNASGLEIMNDYGDWSEWYDEDSGYDIFDMIWQDEYMDLLKDENENHSR